MQATSGAPTLQALPTTNALTPQFASSQSVCIRCPEPPPTCISKLSIANAQISHTSQSFFTHRLQLAQTCSIFRRDSDRPRKGPPCLERFHLNKWYMLKMTSSVLLQSLLSLAGFPDLAGVDKNARISTSQFADFRDFFSATVASVRHVATLWNSRTPSCVLGGFDVDQAAAAAALLTQPVGTFACFFSMQRQFAGHLVVACKV